MDVGDELAQDIVSGLVEDGLSPKQSVIEACGGADNKYAESWRAFFEHPKVQKKLGNYTGEQAKQALQSMSLDNIVKLKMLADNTGDDRVEYQTRRFLSEVAGISKTDEVEITHKNEFQSMGAEELFEYLDGLPGVEVDRVSFTKGIFQ